MNRQIAAVFGFCCTMVVSHAHAQWSLYGTRCVYMAGNVGIGTTNPAFALDVRTPGPRAIFGLATASTGIYYGVVGQSNSTSGRGVFGSAAASTGSAVGVMGQSSSATGFGVYGVAASTTGTNYGVFGRSNSPLGYAGFFDGNLGVTGWIGHSAPMPIDLYSGNTRVFRAQWASSGGVISPNIIAGHIANNISDGIIGAAIGGGGKNTHPNGVSGEFGTVAGGYGNLASEHGFVGGGHYNKTYGHGASIVGGSMNTANGTIATIGGGLLNYASGDFSTIGGGEDNFAAGVYSTVAGGASNKATDNDCTVGGGVRNFAGNGEADLLDATHATVAGGLDNQATAHASAIAGGKLNFANGQFSAVPGGLQNVADGFATFAAGYGALAKHDGSFIWSDSTGGPTSSSADNQFVVRASGGSTFVDVNNIGVHLAPGSNSWSAFSDRNVKDNITPIDPRQVLAKLVAMPVTQWNLISQDDSIKHMGPMAQDFYSAFGLGEDNRRISHSNADGVIMAAIQGLHMLVEEKAAENKQLKERLERIESMLATRGLTADSAP